jgi:hypothetical protein
MQEKATLVLALALAFACAPAPSQARPASSTYYVRTDGGSPTQCTGLADAPYPGSGTGQPCAWDHPFRVLPPGGSPRISGGDTLVIGAGSYRMGYGAPGDGNCDSDYPWDCHMPPIPSGPDSAHPTRILGDGWDTGCTNPPELWGAERASMILNLTDASNVEIGCLEITDHSACVEFHSGGLTCERDAYPYGDWAADGLYAEDSADVHLRHLNIHGLAAAGVRAGRLTDWTVEDVRVAGNGWVGWEGDIEGDDSNSGTLTFRRWTVEWNGCGETWPGGQPTGCWAQTAGGYGDGVGTGATGGDWTIEDSRFLHNTSDGLDLLYHNQGGSVLLRRVWAEGNAGDQIKTAGPTTVENVIAVSNCGFFEGQSFTHDVDNCRAGGSAIALTLGAGDQASVVNSTVTGQGDCLVIAECMGGDTCDGSEAILLRNTIFQGNPEFGQPGDTTCLTWYGTAHDPFTIDHAIISEVKGTPDPCPTDSLCDTSPGLVDSDIDTFDAHPLASSPAIDAGVASDAPADDFDGFPRYGVPDVGAYEYSYLKITPASRAIDPGGVAVYTLDVRSVGGSTDPVGLAASSPSPSLTLQLTQTVVTPLGQVTLTVSDTHTGSTLWPGLWYNIPITATGEAIQVVSAHLLVGGARIYLPVVLRE